MIAAKNIRRWYYILRSYVTQGTGELCLFIKLLSEAGRNVLHNIMEDVEDQSKHRNSPALPVIDCPLNWVLVRAPSTPACFTEVLVQSGFSYSVFAPVMLPLVCFLPVSHPPVYWTEFWCLTMCCHHYSACEYTHHQLCPSVWCPPVSCISTVSTNTVSMSTVSTKIWCMVSNNSVYQYGLHQQNVIQWATYETASHYSPLQYLS